MSTETQLTETDELLTTVALIEFSVHTRSSNPELAERAEQLAADRLIDYDMTPYEVVEQVW